MAFNFMRRTKSTPSVIMTTEKHCYLKPKRSTTNPQSLPERPLDSLPPDVLARIFTHIEYATLHVSIRPACRLFASLIRDPISFIPEVLPTQVAKRPRFFRGFSRTSIRKASIPGRINLPREAPVIELRFKILADHLFRSVNEDLRRLHLFRTLALTWSQKDFHGFYKIHPCLKLLYADYSVLSKRPMRIEDVGFINSGQNFISLNATRIRCEHATDFPADKLTLTCNGVFEEYDQEKVYYDNPFHSEAKELIADEKTWQGRGGITVMQVVMNAIGIINEKREQIMRRRRIGWKKLEAEEKGNWPNSIENLFNHAELKFNTWHGGFFTALQMIVEFPSKSDIKAITESKVVDGDEVMIDSQAEMDIANDAEDENERNYTYEEMDGTRKWDTIEDSMMDDYDDDPERTLVGGRDEDWELLHQIKYSQLDFPGFDGVYLQG